MRSLLIKVVFRDAHLQGRYSTLQYTSSAAAEPIPRMTHARETNLTDLGQVWVQWDKGAAFGDARLARAVSAFQPVDCPTGRAAARWLLQDSLSSHGLTLTFLMLLDGQVQAFYAVSATNVTLSTRATVHFGLEGLTHGVGLIAWLCKAASSPFSGLDVLAHAMERVGLATGSDELIGVALDPYTQETEAMWRNPPYSFLRSETRLPNGLRRLWRPFADVANHDGKIGFRS